MRYRDLLLKRFQTQKEEDWNANFLAPFFVPLFPGVRGLSPEAQATVTQSFVDLLKNARREDQSTYAYLGRAFLEGAQALKDFLKTDPERIAMAVADIIKDGPGANPFATLQDWNQKLLTQLGIEANPQLVQALTLLQFERANMYYQNTFWTAERPPALPLGVAIQASGTSLSTGLGAWPSAANQVINWYNALRGRGT
jgi:hypothetical protein